MDIVKVYMRLQAIGKLCIVAAWIVIVLGILLFSYLFFNISSNSLSYIDGSTYLFMLFMLFISLAIPVGTFAILLFASGTLIAYITMQEGSPEQELDDDQVPGDQDDDHLLEISSISKNERQTNI
jgi:predicted membrane protein